MNANDLLLWLSARGSGNWSRYRAAVDELHLPDDDNGTDEDLNEALDASGLPVHHRLRLNLERLGHAEFFRKDFPNGWRVVSPTLAALVTGTGAIGTLCGARTDELIQRLTTAADRFPIQTTHLECPDCIQITADSQEELQQIARAAGLQFQPDASRMLLAATPGARNSELARWVEVFAT